jgi:hypothetical protein
MNTAWTADDLLVNLTAEVKAVKEFYGVPSLDHVPDSELTPIRYAQLGDLVPLGKGRVGIVYDSMECGGSEAIAIVANNGRTITRTRRL